MAGNDAVFVFKLFNYWSRLEWQCISYLFNQIGEVVVPTGYAVCCHFVNLMENSTFVQTSSQFMNNFILSQMHQQYLY
jgi:hypothetical protein